MRYELWVEYDCRFTLCEEGPAGDPARALMEPGASLVRHVEAETWDEAMAAYHEHMSQKPSRPKD